MANYTKATDFAAKDALTTGDPDKVIKGVEFEAEFDAIATAVNSKADAANPALTGTVSINGTNLTSTAAELNILDGVTSTAAELNILDGVTSTTAELNILDGVTAFLDEDNMASNSATALASQQSIKAYVDAVDVNNPTGDVTITTGSIILDSGEGIDFSATGNGSGTTSSEVFDDYEEGTFTPTIVGFSGSGATYSTQTGQYTKIGDYVFFDVIMAITSLGTLSGSLKLGGLPFTCAGADGLGNLVCGGAAGLSITASESIVGHSDGGAARFFLQLWDGTSGPTALAPADLSPTTILYFSGQYKT